MLYLILVGPAILLVLWAQMKVKSAYSKYSQVRNFKNITGAQAAEMILKQSGIYNVSIEMVKGELSDHYDPKEKVLRLSERVFHQSSIASLGIAAHEAGHALQHAQGYGWMEIRQNLAPIAVTGSQVSFFLLILGGLLGIMQLAFLGIILFAVAVLFQIVTLPVEFDASKRAKNLLLQYGIVAAGEEAEGVNKVLSAAALTYVAGAFSSLMQLLYFVLQFTGMGRNED